MLCPIEYTLEPESGMDPDTNIYTGIQKVKFKNIGYNDAFDVTATISSAPANVFVSDPDITLGDIPAGGSLWSEDAYTVEVDMSNPQDPNEGIFYTVTYYVEGNPEPQYLYNVPMFCDDCIPPIPTDPDPPPPAGHWPPARLMPAPPCRHAKAQRWAPALSFMSLAAHAVIVNHRERA